MIAFDQSSLCSGSYLSTKFVVSWLTFDHTNKSPGIQCEDWCVSKGLTSCGLVKTPAASAPGQAVFEVTSSHTLAILLLYEQLNWTDYRVEWVEWELHFGSQGAHTHKHSIRELTHSTQLPILIVISIVICFFFLLLFFFSFFFFQLQKSICIKCTLFVRI